MALFIQLLVRLLDSHYFQSDILRGKSFAIVLAFIDNHSISVFPCR